MRVRDRVRVRVRARVRAHITVRAKVRVRARAQVRVRARAKVRVRVRSPGGRVGWLARRDQPPPTVAQPCSQSPRPAARWPG